MALQPGRLLVLIFKGPCSELFHMGRTDLLTVQKTLEFFQKFVIKLKVFRCSDLFFPVLNFKDQAKKIEREER